MGGVFGQLHRAYEDFAGAARLAADFRSFVRMATDLALYRVTRFVTLPGQNRERQVRLRGGTVITYRNNRGDVWALHQMWIKETCRLPIALKPEIIVDLGANIGLAGLWLAKQYGCARLIAVEPVASNAALTRRNLADNGIRADVLEAAIGPQDGTALFEEPISSANGKLILSNRSAIPSAGTWKQYEVLVVSMKTVLGMLPPEGQVDLLKLDVEGAEQSLLCGEPDWLAYVSSVVAEFHPPTADIAELTKVFQNAGFTRLPMPAEPEYTDFFTRSVK